MNNIIYRDAYTTVFQSTLYQTNSTVISTPDVVMVIDPAWLPDEVLNIRNYVEEIRKGRPIFLIFTHSDYDHIIGYRAFEAEKVFMSEAMSKNPKQNKCVEDMLNWDAEYYVNRPYPLEYPTGDFIVFRDGLHYRYGKTKLAFYLTPGHTADSMMVVVWQIGLLIAGDYLSDVEFPFIYDSSESYIETMNKLTLIHDRNWFTRMIPGHGKPALNISDWLNRRSLSLEYIYALRQMVALGTPFQEELFWQNYPFRLAQEKVHQANIELIKKEYERGDWRWDAAENEQSLKTRPKNHGMDHHRKSMDNEWR